MVDRKDPLPVTRQCALLDLPRSTFYHVPKPVSEEELEQMALIDRCHLKHSFYGSRRIYDWLEDHGYRVNRKKVQRLMRTMDLVAQGAGHLLGPARSWPPTTGTSSLPRHCASG